MMKSLITVRFLIVTTTLMLGITRAQNIPRLGRASDALWSKSTELNVGKALYDRLYRQGYLHQDQADNDYINYLGHKIGAFAQTRVGLRFYLTNINKINAFAAPGGYVAVNAGLILATDNEHELAGVLAHEIGHVAQEHIARSLIAAKDRRIANMAAMALGALLATNGHARDAGLGMMSGAVAAEQQQRINAIRRHEIEADKTGRQLMTKAGFNERGMQDFFAKLQTPVNADAIPAYLLTHPLPLDRQAVIDRPGALKKGFLRSSDEYFLFRARIRASQLNQKRLQEIIAEERGSPRLQTRDASYFLAALVAMKQGQPKQALAKLSAMKTTMRKKRDVMLLTAKLHRLGGNNKQAEKTYQQLWRRFSGDSVIAYDYAHFLLQKGQYQRAETLLKNQLDSDALNPELYFLYGQVLGRRGETIKQNRMLIRYYEQSGNYQQALNQTSIALSLPQLDWKNRSMFEAKRESLQRLVDGLSD